jgi:hypothetical protein
VLFKCIDIKFLKFDDILLKGAVLILFKETKIAMMCLIILFVRWRK